MTATRINNETETRAWLIAGVLVTVQADAAGCTVALTANAEAPPRDAGDALLALVHALADARRAILQEADHEHK